MTGKGSSLGIAALVGVLAGVGACAEAGTEPAHSIRSDAGFNARLAAVYGKDSDVLLADLVDFQFSTVSIFPRDTASSAVAEATGLPELADVYRAASGYTGTGPGTLFVFCRDGEVVDMVGYPDIITLGLSVQQTFSSDAVLAHGAEFVEPSGTVPTPTCG